MTRADRIVHQVNIQIPFVFLLLLLLLLLLLCSLHLFGSASLLQATAAGKRSNKGNEQNNKFYHKNKGPIKQNYDLLPQDVSEYKTDSGSVSRTSEVCTVTNQVLATDATELTNLLVASTIVIKMHRSLHAVFFTAFTCSVSQKTDTQFRR
jgi:hypothetical protein